MLVELDPDPGRPWELCRVRPLQAALAESGESLMGVARGFLVAPNLNPILTVWSWPQTRRKRQVPLHPLLVQALSREWAFLKTRSPLTEQHSDMIWTGLSQRSQDPSNANPSY